MTNKKNQNQKIKQFVRKWWALILFGVVPYMIIALFRLSGQPEWIGRMIALSIVLSTVIPILVWYSLSFKTEMIKKGASLDKPGYEKTKKIADRIIRLFFIGIALGFLIFLAVPFSKDVLLILRGEKPLEVRGRVFDNSTPFGAWFLSQSVSLEGREDKYYLLYSLNPRLKRQESYEFVVLYNSKVILEVRQINSDYFTEE